MEYGSFLLKKKRVIKLQLKFKYCFVLPKRITNYKKRDITNISFFQNAVCFLFHSFSVSQNQFFSIKLLLEIEINNKHQNKTLRSAFVSLWLLTQEHRQGTPQRPTSLLPSWDRPTSWRMLPPLAITPGPPAKQLLSWRRPVRHIILIPTWFLTPAVPVEELLQKQLNHTCRRKVRGWTLDIGNLTGHFTLRLPRPKSEPNCLG